MILYYLLIEDTYFRKPDVIGKINDTYINKMRKRNAKTMSVKLFVKFAFEIKSKDQSFL